MIQKWQTVIKQQLRQLCAPLRGTAQLWKIIDLKETEKLQSQNIILKFCYRRIEYDAYQAFESLRMILVAPGLLEEIADDNQRRDAWRLQQQQAQQQLANQQQVIEQQLPQDNNPAPAQPNFNLEPSDFGL